MQNNSQVFTPLIDAIVKRRGERIAPLKERRSFLMDVKRTLDDFEHFRASLVDDNGNVINGCAFEQELMTDLNKAKKIAALKQIRERLIYQIDGQIGEIDELINRFGRKGIHIGVVGFAGTGKSRLLQTISGLGNEVILSADGDHCTGTKSIIHNIPQGGLKINESLISDFRVEIVFYSKEEIVQLFNMYLSEIQKEFAFEKKEIKTIYSIEEIKDFDINSIEATSIYFDTLCQYIENYDLILSLTNQEKRVIGKSEISLIEQYVAQHDVKDTKQFKNYLAVKEAHIFCTFKYPDAGQIVLIDTVGLGAITVGDKNKLLSSIKEDCDAVIFLDSPSDKRPTLGAAEAKLLQEIIKTNEGIEKKLFYVINQRKLRHGGEVIDDQMAKAEKYLQTLKTKHLDVPKDTIKAVEVQIIDCSENEEVSNKLIQPLLAYLSKNLESFDNEIISTANDSGVQLFGRYSAFYEEVKGVLNVDVDSTDGRRVFRDCFNKLLNPIVFTRLEYLMQERRDEKPDDCVMVGNIFHSLTNPALVETKYLAPIKTSIDKILLGGTMINAVYEECLHELRRTVPDAFRVDIDQLLEHIVKEVKLHIVEILASDEYGRLGRVVRADINNPEKWLNTFYSIYLPEDSYPILHSAVKELAEFSIESKGFLIARIRKYFDYLRTNTLNGQVDLSGGTDRQEERAMIQHSLAMKMRSLLSDVREELANFSQDPNIAACYAIEDFYDTVSFSDASRDEWEDLYSKYAQIIWSTEYDKLSREQVAFSEWRAKLSSLNTYLNETKFSLNNL